MIIDWLALTVIIFTILCLVSIICGMVTDDADTIANCFGFGIFGLIIVAFVGWLIVLGVHDAKVVSRPVNVTVNVRPNFLTLDTPTETVMTINDVPTYNRFVNETNTITIYQHGGVNNYNKTNWYKNYTFTDK